MACDWCAFNAMLATSRFNVFRMLFLVQLAFVLLGSSPILAESESSYHYYDVVPGSLPGDEVTHDFRTYDSIKKYSVRKRRDIDSKPKDEPQIESVPEPASKESIKNSSSNENVDSSLGKITDPTYDTFGNGDVVRTWNGTSQYYDSTIINDENIAKTYWVDMANRKDVQVNEKLSNSYRKLNALQLKFDFPYYGEKTRNISIATGGFLSTSEYLHSSMTASQYVAPLMANFDTRVSKDSLVKYADNGTAFTVEWENVVLQDRPEAGGFTFQVTLYDSGHIVFVYTKIPMKPEAIEDTAHPAKIGISDSYIGEIELYFVPRKVIREYDRILFDRANVGNWTAIYLHALPTCVEQKNCHDCLTKLPESNCKWCPKLEKCSNGVYRHQQNWINAGCKESSITEELECPAPPNSSNQDNEIPSESSSKDEKRERKRRFSGLEPEDKTRVTEPIPEQPVIKTEASSVNVTYSTDKVAPSNGTAGHLNVNTNVTETTIAAPKLEIPKSTKNTTVIVSNPMNAANEQPVPKVHIWANQTRWDNATQKSVTNVESTTEMTNPDDKKDASGKNDEKMNDTTSMKNATQQTSNATDQGDLGDLSISKFSDVTNNTLVLNNITKTEEDTHQYYNSTFFSDENVAKMYWVDMDNHPDRQVNKLLSESHRRAATVKLKFDFPFYGHKVRNITIATGGFLYTGEYVHSWLAATQYIAPLMANFDTRISNDSWVKYADNGTAFTVEWEKVVLQDRPEAGGFTFQATLHDNGNIVFVYSKIPLTVEAIEDTAHPVKVGLSDAYIMDRTIFFVRRKTIYEYHRVNFNRQEIRNWTVIYLRALPTCLEMDNCNDCLTKVPEFECKWCPELRRCSTGTFRFRQDWLEKGCEQRNIRDKNSCPATQTPYSDNADGHDHPGYVRSDASLLSSSADQNRMGAKGQAGPSILEHTANNMNMGVSGIIGILLVVSLVTGLAAWAGYAYRNPHSASGQMLIRYRPSQWSWRRGEARYTAATIHM